MWWMQVIMVPLVPDVHAAAPQGESFAAAAAAAAGGDGAGNVAHKLSSTALRERESQAGAGQCGRQE